MGVTRETVKICTKLKHNIKIQADHKNFNLSFSKQSSTKFNKPNRDVEFF